MYPIEVVKYTSLERDNNIADERYYHDVSLERKGNIAHREVCSAHRYDT